MLEGEELTVECVADTSYSNVDYAWVYPDTDPLSSSSVATILNYRNRLTIPSYFGNLVLSNIELERSGVFTCQVRLIGAGVNGSNINAQTNGEVMVEVQCECVN